MTEATTLDVRVASARRVLVRSQVVFFASLAACILLDHSRRAQTDGISFYGVHRPTIALAVIGYLSAAVGLWRCASILGGAGQPVRAVLGLKVVAVELVVLLGTPYSLGTFLNWAHMTTGVIGALVQLALSWWVVRTYSGSVPFAPFVVTLAGGVLAAFALPDWRFNPLLQGELIFELGFAWSLVAWVHSLESAPQPPSNGWSTPRER